MPPEDCVLWRGPTHVRGYGVVCVAMRRLLAHRLFYLLYNGSIPRGFAVHHTCGNKLCVNPAHLVALSGSDHNREHGDHTERATAASVRSRRARTHCPAGHAYTPENTLTRRNGARACRECRRKWAHRYYLKTKERAA